MTLIARNESPTEKFVWTIKNFNRLTFSRPTIFKGPIIHKRHARKVWRFFLYPASISDPNFMGAYFAKAYQIFDPAIYNFSLSIGDSDGHPVKSFEFPSTDFATFSIGGDKCLRRDYIEKLRKGCITVKCEVMELSQKSSFHSTVADFENLSSDLAELYETHLLSDLTVCIGGSKFFIHTCVLYARARRFCHFFGYQNFNQMPKTIEINNISQSHFHQLMYYIYSGKPIDWKYELEIFMFAHKLQLQSIKQQLYEKTREHRTYSEVAVQTLEITWSLNTLPFHKKGTIPFVQIFHLSCCMTHLAVRMGISKNCDGENCVDVSFQVFFGSLHKHVCLVCAMTLIYNGEIHTYKKDSCNIDPEEEWHFPPFIKISDIPDEYCCSRVYLTAEISLSDGCLAFSNFRTKTLLCKQTDFYHERLGSDMRRLRSPNIESRFKKHDLYLKSSDNICMPVHKAILYARWPSMRRRLLKINEPNPHLQLNLCSEEIEMLLDYIYTGSLPSLDHSSAEMWLQLNAKMKCPPYLVRKCQNLLCGITD